MKNAISLLIFSSAFLAVVFAYPGSYLQQSDRADALEGVGPILVLSDDLEDSVGGGFFSSFPVDPFNGLAERMRSLMDRLRQQLAQSIPSYSDQGGFFGFGNIPEGANTTSTKKVIDGHVVTVNETTYKDGDNVQGTVLRIRIVDIQPENQPTTENPEVEGTLVTDEEQTTPSATDRSVETVEDLTDNEIPERIVQVQSN